jgi:peptidoglycan hydrolase-like protein with peptidoglycan-binding domain
MAFNRMLLAAILAGSLGFATQIAQAQIAPGEGERVPETERPPAAGGELRHKEPALSQEKVKQIEQALKDRGHDPGAIDGVMDQQTRDALMAFQKSNDLPTTGRIDEQTAQKLGVMIEEKPATLPRSPAAGAPSRAPKQPGGH